MDLEQVNAVRTILLNYDRRINALEQKFEEMSSAALKFNSTNDFNVSYDQESLTSFFSTHIDNRPPSPLSDSMENKFSSFLPFEIPSPINTSVQSEVIQISPEYFQNMKEEVIVNKYTKAELEEIRDDVNLKSNSAPTTAKLPIIMIEPDRLSFKSALVTSTFSHSISSLSKPVEKPRHHSTDKVHKSNYQSRVELETSRPKIFPKIRKSVPAVNVAARTKSNPRKEITAIEREETKNDNSTTSIIPEAAVKRFYVIEGGN